MLFERLTPDFCYQDSRGSLVQLVHNGYKQMNVITSKAGMIRGGHYHKVNYEAFYVVSGSCEVTFIQDGPEETQTFTAGDFFRIAPYIGHVFNYTQDTILIGLYDNGVENSNGEKDIFPIENHS